MLLCSGVTARSSFILQVTCQKIQREVTLVKETVEGLLWWRYNNIYNLLSSNKFDLPIPIKLCLLGITKLVLLKPIPAHRVLQINGGIRLALCRGVRVVIVMANMDSTHTYSVCVAGWKKSLTKQALQMMSDLPTWKETFATHEINTLVKCDQTFKLMNKSEFFVCWYQCVSMEFLSVYWLWEWAGLFFIIVAPPTCLSCN